jgi:hypothetical protein
MGKRAFVACEGRSPQSRLSQEPPLSLSLSPRRGRGDLQLASLVRDEGRVGPLSPREAGRGIGRGAALGTPLASEPAAKVRHD